MTDLTVTSGLDHLSVAGIGIMKANQDPSGAFLASPNFGVYHYSWLRDGSYVAMALSRAGEREAALAFHEWTALALAGQAERIEEILAAHRAGRAIDRRLLLPTRYLVTGAVEESGGEEWPTVQFDGYGTWLWTLAEHLGAQPLSAELSHAVRLAADYLVAVWELPCYDYWEEFGDRQHTSTLASVAAGLRAASTLVGEPGYATTADRVWSWVLANCVRDGHFVKGPQDDRVDASLVSLAVPFALIRADDPLYAATVATIAAELTAPVGGVWRYLGDTYFGGGTWVLLTCWLGWAQLAGGDADAARAQLRWARDCASADGWLPEQIADDDHSQHPDWRQPWVEKWGEPADPLLWSHAMYLLLDDALLRSQGDSHR